MSQANSSSGFKVLVGLAAFIIVVAGIKSASSLVVTLLLSGFIAILCAPSYIFMQKHKVPSWLAILILMGFLVVVQIGFVSLAANTVSEFTSDLPMYKEKLQGFILNVASKASEFGMNISPDFVRQHLDPSVGFEFATSMLSGLGSFASNAFMILLAVLFILLEGSSFPHKLRLAFEGNTTLNGATRFTKTVKDYMRIKTGVSLTTGFLVFLLLWLVGVEYALVWAMLAFLFNFVPSIGSVIAAVPAVLLTIVQLGPVDAAIVAAGYAAINIILGNVIEPRLMGKGMGLSPLVVFLSLVFWGWVLGPVGMLLSVPLTVLFKIAMDGSDETRWLSILLGPDMTDEDFESLKTDTSKEDDNDQP